ncbi:MAG: NfeD family protein [Desulfovibrio sp.]|jgi:membrane protein implicated in regulation of membrane protease activity|nr:NfeD family protein [Desulfovibrio sp.]
MLDLLQGADPFWVWLCAGGLLLALELLVGGSAFFLCISSAAFIPAAVAYMRPGLPWLWSLTLFAFLLVPASLAWLRFIRHRQAGRRSGEVLNERAGRLTGTEAILKEDSAGLKGRIRVEDSSWPYVCAEPLRKGDRVRITGAEGIMLRVEKCAGGEEAEDRD